MTTPTPRLDAYAHLADVLGEERRLLDRLLFRAITVRLLLAADERRYVSAAADEVEAVIAQLADAEADRARALPAVARLLDAEPGEVSLQLLAHRAPPPFDHVFRDHERAFLDLVDEIQTVVSENARLVTTTVGYIDRSLRLLDGSEPSTTYGGDGRPHDVLSHAGVRLDQRA